MVRNDTKLSRAVCNDVESPLHCLTGQDQSKRGRSCSPFLVNGWTNEYFFDWSAFSNYRALETMFWNAIPRTLANLQLLCNTESTGWLERRHHLWPWTSRTSSCTTGCYDPLTHLLTPHTQVATFYCSASWPHELIIRPLPVGPYQACTIHRWTSSSTSMLGHRYAGDGSATTLSYVV